MSETGKDLLKIFIGKALLFLSHSIILPILPLYLVKLGASTTEVGFVMGSFAFGVLICRWIAGRVIDWKGRKYGMIVGGAIYIIAPLLYTLILEPLGFVPVRIFHGMGLAFYGTAAMTLTVDITPKEKRGFVIGYMGMSWTLSFVFGPLLGSAYIAYWSMGSLFLVATGIAVVSYLCTWLVRRDAPVDLSQGHVNFFEAVGQKVIVIPTCIILGVALVNGCALMYLPLLLNERFTINLGVFYSIFALASLCMRLVAGRVSDRIGQPPIIFSALLTLAIGIYMISGMESVAYLVCAALVYGMGLGALQVTMMAFVSGNTNKRNRGTIIGFYFTSFDIGVTSAGLLLGGLAELIGVPALFRYLTGVPIAGILLFMYLLRTQLLPGQTFRTAIFRSFPEHRLEL